MLLLARRAFDHLEPRIIFLRLGIVSESEEVLDHFEGHRTAEKGLLVHAENQTRRGVAEQGGPTAILDPKRENGRTQKARAAPERRLSLVNETLTTWPSFDADVLKSPLLCEECNTSRTQPHDRAWEKLSTFLRTLKPEPGTMVDASHIFPDSPTQQMLNVHLYFVKLFGCRVVEAGAPIDSRAFSNAILNGTAHPHLYLRVGRIIPFAEGKECAGFTKIYPIHGPSVFWWLYGIGCMIVQYCMRQMWHCSRREHGTHDWVQIDL
jgi:hypothetical protein